MINFIKNFLPNLSNEISPLRELLKNNIEWSWTNVHDESFIKIKTLISTSTALVPFDFKKNIEIQCDSSKDAIGACLLQEGRPVAFISRCLTATEVQYAQIEKELLACTWALSKFHFYVYGHNNVVIHTDHQPLTVIIKKELGDIKNNRLRRLRLKLLPYNFELKYLPGNFMYVADYLSRNFIRRNIADDETMTETIHLVTAYNITFSEEKLNLFKKETNNDKVLSQLKEFYTKGWPRKLNNDNEELMHFYKLRNEITVEHNLVYFKGRLIVPITLRTFVLKTAHETHLGLHKIKDKTCNLFYWPAIRSSLIDFVQSCKICQKFQKSKIKDPLLSHKIPDIPFLKIGMDFAEFKNQNYLVVVDYYSRWLEVVKVRNKDSITVSTVLKEIFSRFGIPEVVIADNMPFNSYSFREFAEQWNFKIITSSPHYSKANGLAEKYVGITKKMLAKSEESKCDFQLSLLDYRNSPVAGMQWYPAQLLLSKNLRAKFPTKLQLLKPVVVEQAVELMKENQLKQSKYYNQSCTCGNVEFSVNDKVLVRNVKSNVWEKRIIVEKLNFPPRSYLNY